MKVLVFGDIHGLTGKADIPTVDVVVEIVKRTDADLVLQVGDMGGHRPFSRPVHWIFGNNDSISLMQAFDRGESPVENLNHIRNGEALTFRVGEETIAVSGLSGAYDPLYFDFKRDELEDLGYFTEDEVEQCLHLRNIDIFLAHGCPSGLGMGREPDHGNPAIRRIFDSVKPRYMFCGHGHFYREVEFEGCRIYSLDLASKAHYMLDTQSGKLTAFETDPTIVEPAQQ
ncbi:MAG: metallophosphoesterase [Desulfobacterales bacterium]